MTSPGPRCSVLESWTRIIRGLYSNWSGASAVKKPALSILRLCVDPPAGPVRDVPGTSAWSIRRARWLCDHCWYEMSVTARTIFQDSHLPLTLWIRAMWQITSQKNGVSALGLQRVLGLGSYKTA